MQTGHVIGISARTVRSELRIYDFIEFFFFAFVHWPSGKNGVDSKRPRQQTVPTVKLTVLLSELLRCSFVC